MLRLKRADGEKVVVFVDGVPSMEISLDRYASYLEFFGDQRVGILRSELLTEEQKASLEKEREKWEKDRSRPANHPLMGSSNSSISGT